MTGIIVGICGGSASGKSTVTQLMRQSLAMANVIFLDSYYHSLDGMAPADRQHVNFDHPEALDIELLCNHIDCLRRGEPVCVPTYCFATHCRGRTTDRVEPSRVTLIDGVLLFSQPELVNRFDIRIFVDAEDHIRFQRRLRRDLHERQRTRDSVIRQWNQTVLPMHRLYVDPFAHLADVTIANQRDGELPDIRPAVEYVKQFLDQSGDS